MEKPVTKFYAFLDQPLFPSARLALGLLLVPLALSYTQPLWNIHMVAPQYPEGLDLQIYSHKLEGGRDGHDIEEINTLNHYIGMARIDRVALADLDWLPFAFGLLGLLALRVASIGTVRSLIDLVVITLYVSGFGLARFYLKLHAFGHDLDPKAPFKIEPFMPVMFGKKQIANFTTEAYPQLGTVFLTVFGTGIVLLLLWHLVVGRLRAGRAAAANVAA